MCAALISANLFLLHPRACHLETNPHIFFFSSKIPQQGSVIKINNGYKSLLVVLETGDNQRQPELTPCTGGMRYNDGCQTITVKCSLLFYLQGI